MNITFLAPLVGGDYIEIMVWHNQGDNVITGSIDAYLTNRFIVIRIA